MIATRDRYLTFPYEFGFWVTQLATGYWIENNPTLRKKKLTGLNSFEIT